MTTPQSNKYTQAKPFLMLLALIVIIGLSFYAGTDYQKHRQTATPATAVASSGFTARGGFGGGRFAADRIIGQVTAVSATSISVDNSRTGATSTLSIASTTQITDNGQTVAYSDIQNGDTVFITEDSSNTSQAATIVVNPSFGGGLGGSSSPETTNPNAVGE
jgi:hypothetical protein